MENKPLGYSVSVRNVFQGKGKERKLVPMQVATPSARKRISFRSFCEEVAHATTFTPQEVMATLNLASEIAKKIVSNGDSVEYGDLGTLTPSFKSLAVSPEEKFNPQAHILKPVVRFRPSRRYFSLEGLVSYERTERPAKEKKGDKKAEDTGGDTHDGGDSGRPSTGI